MSLEPYASCPCGSGKQFKWCCQPYYGYVEKAMTALEQGQSDAALRNVEELVKKHPKLPQSFGYQAQVLYLMQRFEDADEAVQKALDLDPNFGYGHYLRGVMRQNERELVGALLQYRKAANLIDQNSVEILGQIYDGIADLELQFNRPIAARAAMDKARRYQPGNQELTQLFEAVFGDDSRLPLSARKPYTFRTAKKEKAEAWIAPLESATSGKMVDALKAFEELTKTDPQDAAAWFNLGLVHAWLGETLKAIEAIGQSINLETDDEKNTEAAAMIEVLRCGHGVGDQTDYLSHSIVFRLVQPQAVVQLLQEWEGTGRLIGLRADQQNGTLTGLILEDRPNLGMGIGNPVAPASAHLMIVQEAFRLWHPNKESLDRVVTEIRLKLTSALMDVGQGSGPGQFGDVALEAMSFPHQRADLPQIQSRMEEHAAFFFEETWSKRSLRSLAGMTPTDAAQSTTYRKRLLGVIRFLEECFHGNAPRLGDENAKPVELYDFDRLRAKLSVGAGPAKDTKKFDANALSPTDLQSLDASTLDDEQAEQAFRVALRHELPDVASNLARAVTSRPAKGDRYVLFNHLIEQARQGGRTDEALTLLEEAEKQDREGNDGKRQNDYLLRRAQTLSRKGEVDKSVEAFEMLLKNAPTEGRYFANAAESMLGLKNGKRALQFAEAGLAVARSQNNRDLEGHFLELVSAAKKLG